MCSSRHYTHIKVRDGVVLYALFRRFRLKRPNSRRVQQAYQLTRGDLSI